jgi:hypothetical protein
MSNQIYIPSFISDQNFNPNRVLPRLYFYNGLKQSEAYFIQSGSANLSQSAFPYFNHYSGEPTQGSLSLLFNNETSPYGTTPIDSLYTRYWETYIDLLYNPKTRLFNASAIIPLAEYFDIKLNDIVQWRGNYYHLRAINDYNLKTGECKIQLLGPIITNALDKVEYTTTTTLVPTTSTTSTTTASPTTTSTTTVSPTTSTTTTAAPTTSTTTAVPTTTAAPTTSTTTATPTTTTTLCPCQSGIQITVTTAGTISWIDCFGVNQSSGFAVGNFTISECIQPYSIDFGLEAAGFITDYGTCCTVTTSTTLAPTTSTTLAPTTTTTLCPCYNNIVIQVTNPGAINWLDCFGISGGGGYTNGEYTLTDCIQPDTIEGSDGGAFVIVNIGNCCTVTTSTTLSPTTSTTTVAPTTSTTTAAPTTSTTTATPTTTTTLCPCQSGIQFTVSVTGPEPGVNWLNCFGVSDGGYYPDGSYTLTDCVQPDSFIGTDCVVTITNYGTCCTVTTSTTLSPTTSTTTAVPTTTAAPTTSTTTAPPTTSTTTAPPTTSTTTAPPTTSTTTAVPTTTVAPTTTTTLCPCQSGIQFNVSITGGEPGVNWLDCFGISNGGFYPDGSYTLTDCIQPDTLVGTDCVVTITNYGTCCTVTTSTTLSPTTSTTTAVPTTTAAPTTSTTTAVPTTTAAPTTSTTTAVPTTTAAPTTSTTTAPPTTSTTTAVPTTTAAPTTTTIAPTTTTTAAPTTTTTTICCHSYQVDNVTEPEFGLTALVEYTDCNGVPQEAYISAGGGITICAICGTVVDVYNYCTITDNGPC